MGMILLCLLLSLPVQAEFLPLPADTPESTNKNFKDLSEEVARLQSVISSTASAGATLSGNNAFTGNNTHGSSETFSGLSTFPGDVIGATKIYFSSGTPNQTMDLTVYEEVVGSTLTVTIPSTRNIRVRLNAWVTSGSSYGHTFTGAICESGVAVTVMCEVYLNSSLYLDCTGEQYISATAGTHSYYVCGKMDQYSCVLGETGRVPYLFSITY